MSVGDERDRASAGGPRVLVVGADASIAGALDALGERFTVDSVPTATAAFEHLTDTPADCVICGDVLPETDVEEFLASIDDRYPDLPTVLSVGPSQADLATEALEAGATDCLVRETLVTTPELLGNRIETIVDSVGNRRPGRHERLVRETSDAIAIMDAEGTFEFVSPSSERVVGYAPVELEGKDGNEYVHPEDRDAAVGLFEELTDSPMMQATTEFRFEHADGSWVWLEARGRNLRHDPEVDGIVITARDITDRKRRERDLRESEERYRQLLESSPGPVFIYSASGEMVYVNGAGLDLLDADAEEDLIGTNSGDFTHPDDRPTVDDRYERLVEDREPVPPTELRLRSETGETKYAVMSSTPVTYGGEPAIQTVGMDITEAKERERELQRERDRFTTLFENLPSPVVYGVLEDGEPIVRTVNSRFEEVFGYDAEAIGGANLDELIVPDDLEGEAMSLNREIQEEGVIRDEVRRESADGLRDFELRVVIDPGTDPPEGYAIYTDITDRKERERELERKTARLDEFATVVSHDLRNPLGVAIGNLELVREDCDSPRLDEVQDAHHRMEALIDDVLTIAREGRRVQSVRDVDLDEVVDAGWSNVETGAATLVNDADGSVPAAENRLQRLLENLIRNAVDHGPADVTVRVGDLDNGFFVADDGPGIPDGEQGRVFEAGFSTTEDGTGFGLNIVQEIAEAHGWRVEVTESDEGGARFEIIDGR